MRAGELVAGRYRLEEPVGSGGMGVVWRAVDERLGRVVALKQAHPADLDGERGRRQLRREARIAASLDHPHVVTFFGVLDEGTEWWLVMEYVPSKSLAELLENDGPLAPERVARIGVQLAGALAAVHAQGVLHRDVKPGNVLITEDGTAKLADFGISRVVGGEVTQTQTGLIGGTPAYLAPEVANGEDPTAASDVFSLGATLFAAVEGASPFGTSDNALAVLRRAATGEVSPSRRGGPLAPVLAALLQRRPENRPDAAGARQLLQNAIDGLEPPRATRGFRLHRRPVRHMATRAAAAVVVLAFAIWLPVTLTENTPPATPATTSANSASAVGDPRTADPCALTDAAALGRFGETRLDTDYGTFDRCDVVVRPGGAVVDVKVQLDGPVQTTGPVDKVGTISVVREPKDSGQCHRTLVLADGNTVTVTARLNDGAPPDLCAIADVATGSALAVLADGEIPRRSAPFEAASLARVSACGLLDADALARVPGVDASKPAAGFGDWECRWLSVAKPISVLVVFDRGQPLTAADGRVSRIGGHEVFVKPGDDGDQNCLARVVYRAYPDADGHQAVELLVVVVSGREPTDQLCGWATGLAGAAAGKLPSP